MQLSRMATLPKEAAEAEAASSMSWRGRGQGVGREVAMVVMERWMELVCLCAGKEALVVVGGRGRKVPVGFW